MPVDEIMTLIGDPAKAREEFEEFHQNTLALSSHKLRMIEEYPKQWVAVFGGVVKARASTLRSLITEIDRLGLPRERVVVRYIDKDRRTMIL